MGGGSGKTSTTGTVAPEFQPLFAKSGQSLIEQQIANPLGQYNEEHPLRVGGANQLQEAGAQTLMGNNLPTGLDALTLQSILRMPGLAGAGPTTGHYNYGREAGLKNDLAFMQPVSGQGGGLDSSPSGNPSLAAFSPPAGRDRGLRDVLDRIRSGGGQVDSSAQDGGRIIPPLRTKPPVRVA